MPPLLMGSRRLLVSPLGIADHLASVPRLRRNKIPDLGVGWA